MTRLAFLLVLAACSPPEPTNEHASPPAGVDLAVAVALDAWSERLEVELRDPPTIEWFEGECLEYSNFEGEPCIIGMTWDGPPGIFIDGLRRYAPNVIAHELLHWALVEVADDIDSKHKDPHWTEVSDVLAMVEGVL